MTVYAYDFERFSRGIRFRAYATHGSEALHSSTVSLRLMFFKSEHILMAQFPEVLSTLIITTFC